MSVLASHKSPAKSPRNSANKRATHDETHGVAEVQTDAIMVPFPLPPIGTIKPETKPVESVSMQTEYTWMFNEFPTKREDFSVVDRAQKSHNVVKPAAVSDIYSNAASPKKVTQKNKIVREQEPEPMVVVAPEPATVAPEATVTGEVTFADDTEDAVMSEESAFVSQTETAAPGEETHPPKAETPKKKARSPRKPKAIEQVPATPASTAVPDTPISVSSPIAEKVVSKTMPKLPPVLSDSSDDESRPLIRKVPALTRKITPVQVKPSITTNARPQVVAVPPNTPVESDSSSSESEKEAMSSSSDSDGDIPAISMITSNKTSKRKEPESPATPAATKASRSQPTPIVDTLPGHTRMGPLVQVDDANEAHLETIHENILDMIPEPLKAGSIKEAVFDEANKRLIFQLRISPRVVNFLNADGGMVKIDAQGSERKLVVLNESLKKKAAHLFKAAVAEESVTTPVPKRNRK